MFHMFKKYTIPTFILLFFILPVSAQQIKISGKVKFQESETQPLYDVLALRLDSTIIKGEVIYSEEFTFTCNPDSIGYIKISSLGYEPVIYTKEHLLSLSDNQKTVYLGTIHLVNNLILSDIIITGKRKTFTISPTGYSINVKDSYLSGYGTFDEVIMRIPGLNISPKGDIEVIGKGKVLYVLNGRRLNSITELQLLKPQDIKTINIDQSPGPEYDASYDAVVRIETNDYIHDFYYADLLNRITFSRKISNNSRISVERKKRNFVYGLHIDYTEKGTRQYDTEHREVWVLNDSVTTDRNATTNIKNQNLTLLPSVKWYINNYHFMEINYNFDHDKTEDNTKQDFRAVALQEKKLIETFTNLHDKLTSHNPSVYYKYSRGKNSLNASVDYYTSYNKNRQYITETYSTKNHNIETQDFKDQYKIWGSSIDHIYTTGKWTVKSGGKISEIKDKGNYITNDDSAIKNTLNDQTYALYTSTSGVISRFSLNAGLRAEWNAVNYHSSSYQEPIKSTHFNFFPSVSGSFKKNSFSGTLSYRKIISRPSYTMLNPNNIYIDPLSYLVGNPLLKSRLTDEVSVSAQYISLYFSTAYTKEKNGRAQISRIDPDKKIRFTYINFPKKETITLLGMYSLNHRWLKSNLTLRALFQELKFEGQTYSKFSDAPVLIARTNVDLNIWKKGGINIIGFYYANYLNNFTQRENTGYLTVGINHSFLQDKFKLTVRMVDILNTFHPNTWEELLPNSYVRMHTNADSRSCYVTLQYKFGKMKATKSTGSITSEEKSRL